MLIIKAVGTSLVIIFINFMLGFLLSISNITVQWSFLLVITALAVIGIIIGGSLASKIDGKKRKPAFDCFVLDGHLYYR
ncbi:hypothetical protein BWD42_06600 [Sphingobacterium sp. CZ-UAM]|uniref:TSUP family transporter n=1 Tax=Sphingobacterium sp. CZ-UAM TaxID=1933868 RepID=UPI00098790A7|nr:hypothetical protein BWD42_06600 [Sphingobacterium sp. CZ-UAM]